MTILPDNFNVTSYNLNYVMKITTK